MHQKERSIRGSLTAHLEAHEGSIHNNNLRQNRHWIKPRTQAVFIITLPLPCPPLSCTCRTSLLGAGGGWIYSPCPLGNICLSLIHISEPTRLGMISYAVF